MPTKHLSRHIFSSTEVSEIYKAMDNNFRSDILEEITKYHYWFYDCCCLSDLGKFLWCSDNSPLSMFLTNEGTTYDLENVAKKYIDYTDDLRLKFPWFVEKVEAIATYSCTYSLPPLIISACRFRTSYYIVDGFHRGLSLLINVMRGIGNQKLIHAYIGFNLGASIIKEVVVK